MRGCSIVPRAPFFIRRPLQSHFSSPSIFHSSPHSLSLFLASPFIIRVNTTYCAFIWIPFFPPRSPLSPSTPTPRRGAPPPFSPALMFQSARARAPHKNVCEITLMPGRLGAQWQLYESSLTRGWSKLPRGRLELGGDIRGRGFECYWNELRSPGEACFIKVL